jgi:phosphopantothenoylcysteine synthetase/decarboxylase
MRILITGGPVHAYLDAVKIITNKFKGGLMAELDMESRPHGFPDDIGNI